MIASTGNARVRAVTALAKKAKARREQGVFLVEGPKMFGELPVERRREVYVSENFLRQQEMCIRDRGRRVSFMSDVRREERRVPMCRCHRRQYNFQGHTGRGVFR